MTPYPAGVSSIVTSNTLQHTATHCNTLQHTATHSIPSGCVVHSDFKYTATHCNTLQHTATHCNTLHTIDDTGWSRLVGCPKLQVIFRKRATNYKALLRKIACEDKGFYDATTLCRERESSVLSFYLYYHFIPYLHR